MESLRTLHKARFTDVLDYGIRLYKKHFRKLFLLNLIFNIPIMVLITVINPMFSDQYLNMLNISPTITAEPNAIFSSILTLYTMIFGVLALNGIYAITLQNVWEGSIIKVLYADVVLKQERTIKQVIRECFKQFGSLLLGKFLYGLIQYAVIAVLYIVAVIGIFAGTFAVMGLATSSMIAPWVTVVLTILGILLVLVVLFFIVILVGFVFGRFWMFLPSICIEQKKAGTAIGRCGNLGKSSFWLISLTYVVGGVFVSLFPGIINMIFSSVNLLSGEVDVTLLKLGAVVTQIFTAVLQPLFICILTALYITLRVKREGLDMEIDLYAIKKEELEKTQRWMAEAPNAAE